MLPKEAKIGTPNHSMPGKAVLAEGLKPAERQRGSWSFLTWSFFLAQMVAAEQFFGSGARAAQNDDASATRANGQSEISSDEAAAGAKWGSAVMKMGRAGRLNSKSSSMLQTACSFPVRVKAQLGLKALQSLRTPSVQ